MSESMFAPGPFMCEPRKALPCPARIRLQVRSPTCEIVHMFKSMFVLALASQKGGVGKTALGINLAVAAARDKRTAVIIDIDPQATAANWKDRSKLENPAVVSAVPSRVRQALEAAEAHGADFVVIDPPGKADNLAILAASFADLVYVPVEGRMSSFETLPGVHGLLQAAQNNPPAFVVLNKIHPSATTQAETVKQMVGEAYPQIPICPHHVATMDSFGTSQDTGKSVFDYEAEGRAASDIRQLYKFTCAQSDKLKRGRK
jgi:chromosome partitioning protein